MHEASIEHSRLGTVRAGLMFTLSVLFLVLLAGLLYSHHFPDHPDPAQAGQSKKGPDSPDSAQTGHSEEESEPPPLNLDAVELIIQLYGLAILWPIFLVEALWGFVARDRRTGFWRPLGRVLLVCLAPPMRIGERTADNEIWLPGLGWRPVDRDLRRTLERFFGVPMIVMALMVLPLLAIEFGAKEQLNAYAGLRRFLEIGNSVVWFAFAIEFIVMVSVAEKKLRYCVQHWVDLAIVLLPLVHFLPVFRLFRLGRVLRLSQLSRMGRVYRMQGLALKAWRAFLVLEVVQRVMGRSLERRLKELEEMLAAREEEVVQLRQEIEELRKRIAEEQARREAGISEDLQKRWRP